MEVRLNPNTPERFHQAVDKLKAKHQAELGESWGRLGDISEQARGDKDNTIRHIKSSSMGPWELIEPRPPTREHAEARPRPSTHL